MSSLTGNQIKNTYQGLLKLADSSTGITQNLQAIEDGLGNNTGLRISTNQLESDNIATFVPLKAQYYGVGFANAAGTQYSSGMQNIILATQFYDNANYDYSAITINVVSATTSSDTLEFALYSTQMINPNGLFPHEPIISGLTADISTTGLKTVVFPSPISFSGYGGGIYWIVYKISNSGVQPTFRPGGAQASLAVTNQAILIYGQVLGFAPNVYTGQVVRGNNGTGTIQAFSGQTTFDNPFANNLNTLQSTSTSLNGNALGFILHTNNS